CHFPLTEDLRALLPSPPASSPPPSIPRPIRRQRPRPQGNVALSLWLGVGSFVALLLVLIAIQANVKRNDQQVEGSNGEQQKSADQFRDALAKDSTDNRARVALADILFDTSNWSEAIVHYRSAVHHDSTLVTAIVD